MPSEAPEFPGLTVHRLDRRTKDEDVFAGVDDSDGEPVRIRVHRARYPSPRQLAWRRHAFDVGQRIADVEGVLRQRALVPVEFDLALVTDAPGTDELDRWMSVSPSPSQSDRLALAISITLAIANLHDRGIVHNALSPVRVAVDPGLEARLSGFHQATSLRSEASGAAGLAGSLTYVSPEQTGRMNRPVDNRSDLYSLGAILFELFGGRPPFTEPDDLALMHAHVARPAPTLSAVAPGVPESLSDLVGCLLEKNPDNRYQTALGVLTDLRLIQSASSSSGGPIVLRSRDVSDQLVISERLIGREAELDVLAGAVDATSAGERTAVFVAGYSGIGKSRLVHEVEPLVVERFGWFVEGKFDQYRRDLPYAGWVGVLEGITRQLLALPARDLETQQAAVAASVGSGAAALVDICRDLEHVVGEQPEPDEVTPLEAQARLTQAVSNFFCAIASEDRPLVVFLDDLQWADLPSMRLLESILTDGRVSHVMLLGAWRENEVTADHPVRTMLRKLEDAGLPWDVLHLPALAVEHVQRIVEGALHQQSDAVLDLGARIHEKTGGNPFFVRQFLEAMHRDGSLSFDTRSAAWTWHPDELTGRTVTDNVAELLEGRLGELSPPALFALQAASVTGTRFRLSAIRQLTGQDPLTAAKALDEALTEQLVTPLDEQYRYAVEEAEQAVVAQRGIELDPEYAFLHDRVQQAAMSTLDDQGRRALHLARARMLEATAADDEDLVVDIAGHLVEATSLLVGPEEQLSAAALLGRAAQRAKSTMALGTATRFLDAALDLLPGDAWSSQYDLNLWLRTEAADVAYIAGQYDDVEVLTAEVLAHAASSLDRVAIHNILIGVGVARVDYAHATQYALEVLANDFGLDLPRHPNTAQVALEMGRCRIAIGRRSTQDLLELPEMRDPRSIAVMGILMKTATNAYWAEPNLVPVIATHMIRLSIAKGNDSLSAYGYALYAMVSGSVLGAEKTGYMFGKLSIDLLERLPNRSLTGRTALLWHGFVRHSRDPLRECASDLVDTYHEALDAGDVENASYCVAVGFYAAALAGHPLDWLLDRFGGYAQGVIAAGQEQSRLALTTWMQAVELLQDPDVASTQLAGERIDWIARREQLVRERGGTALPTEASAAGFLAYLLDDMEEAERNLRLVYEHRDGAAGQPYLGPCFALYATAILRRRARGDRQPTDQARLAWLRHHVNVRARHNAGDMEPFRQFLAAETHRASGRRAQAAAAYLDAAALASSNGVAYLEALALDEAGVLEAQAGHLDQASHLVNRASAAWHRYGVPRRASARAGRDAEVRQPQDLQEDSATGAVDVRTLIETVQAVSREIEVAGLLDRVLSIAVRNAGATRGLLMLVEGGAAEPVAEGVAEADGSISIVTGPESRDADRCQAVVDYIIRTAAPLLIDDAATHELIRHDRRSAERGVRSILCAPLLQSGTLVGVIYLENQIASGVFTPQQLVVVETICGQAAVSLSNARMFEEQRAQAESFSRFVPRPFLERLGRVRISDVGLGDAVTADVTVSFSDLRDFTRLSEGLSATESFELLNAYLGRMGPVISANGGFIDKYVGDAVMSLFIGEADGAVAAAIGMQHALQRFNDERPGETPLRMGLGLHAGEVMLGTVGFADRIETTAIGDTVNTASRVEGASKFFCGAVLITRRVVDRLQNPGPFLLREVGRIQAVGKSEALELHEVLAARPSPEAEQFAETREAFAAGLAAWYGADFESAAGHFSACAETAPSDELAAVYARRCQHLAAHPPEGRWTGIETMQQK